MTARTCANMTGLLLAVLPLAAEGADPWADSVMDASPDLDASGVLNDPQSLLGPPAVTYYDPFAGAQFDVSLVAAPFNLDAVDGDPVITTLGPGSFVKLRFDEPVEDDPRNPFGIDLLVFGNAFFTVSGAITPTSSMQSVFLTGGLVAEPVTVAVSSTGIGSPQSDPDDWYVYVTGPFADTLFPTNAFAWDDAAGNWGSPLDFTLPVDPALELADFALLSAAEAIALYGPSGGGTGYDLDESGFDAVQYVYLASSGGEVDAVSDVRPALGDSDSDGDVDLADAAVFQRCAAHAVVDVPACFFADVNGDSVVDADDTSTFALFLAEEGPR